MKKLSFTDCFMNEVISLGGIPMRRGDAFDIARENQPDWKPGNGSFGPDYQAFAPEPIDAEPWTVNEFRQFEKDMKTPKRFLQTIK